jgi:hypothetical protein
LARNHIIRLILNQKPKGGQKPRAPDTITGFELTSMPPLPASSGIFDLKREGGKGIDCLVVLVHLVVLVVFLIFFSLFPPVRSPATNCGYLCLYPEEGVFRSK